MKKIIPDFCVDLQGPGEAFEDIKQMGLSGETPLGVAKTKAINSDYHKPAEAWHAVVARGYLERAARVDELNGHSPGLRRAYGHRAQEVQRVKSLGVRSCYAACFDSLAMSSGWV